jgi:hypothetical protein
MKLFHAFHAGCLDVSILNYGIITLLPKITGADKISQYSGNPLWLSSVDALTGQNYFSKCFKILKKILACI